MSSETKLPTGVRKWGKKYLSRINVQRKSIHLGLFDTVAECVAAQVAYREKHDIPPPVLGRPKKPRDSQ